MSDRREALRIIGAVGATCAFPFSADSLYGQHEHRTSGEAELPAPRHFSARQMQVIARVADLIIPPTDTPGAIAAGVPAYIDMVVAANARHQKTFREGLAWLDRKGFRTLTGEQQTALLGELAESAEQKKRRGAAERFFEAIKGLTAEGYYTSRAGLVTELGFSGGAVLAEFPGCTHEH